MNSHILIPTGMYADDTAEILKAVQYELCFAHKVAYYFKTRGAPALEIVRAPDGEVCFEVVVGEVGWGKTYRFWNKYLRESFYTKQPIASEVKNVKEQIGWQIKNLAKDFLERQIYTLTEEADRERAEKDWNRQSGVNVNKFLKKLAKPDINVTIADLYFIYEKLIGRLEKSTRKYDSAVVRRLVGEKRDPITTEAEIARREEVKRIKAEYAAKIADATPKYGYGKDASAAYLELERIIAEFKDKCKQRVVELEKERDEKLAEVNAAMCFLAM